MAQNVIGVYHLLVWDDYYLMLANLLSTWQNHCVNDTLKVVNQVTDAVRVLAASWTMYGISSETLQSCILVNTGQTWNTFRCIFYKGKNWESGCESSHEYTHAIALPRVLFIRTFLWFFWVTLCRWIMFALSMHSTKQNHYANICSHRNSC
jgi:hypothetical protein